MCKGMLGNLPLSDIQGPLNEFHQRLAGEQGEEWLRDFKKFLRKEDKPPYMVSSLRDLEGFADTYRVAQALLRYNLGYGKAVGAPSFQEYLDSIPLIPRELLASDEVYPYLVLVEKRASVYECLEFSGLRFNKQRSFSEPHPKRNIRESVYWIRVSTDCSCRDKKPTASSTPEAVALNILEGIALCTQFPGILYTFHTIVIAGSVCDGDPESLPCISRQGPDPFLCVCQDVRNCAYSLARRKVFA